MFPFTVLIKTDEFKAISKKILNIIQCNTTNKHLIYINMRNEYHLLLLYLKSIFCFLETNVHLQCIYNVISIFMSFFYAGKSINLTNFELGKTSYDIQFLEFWTYASRQSTLQLPSIWWFLRISQFSISHFFFPY